MIRLGVILPVFSGDAAKVLRTARDAEALGCDGVFVPDHLFPPGRPGDRPALEAFTTLAAVAALTERVMVGTLVARARMRPVGLLAKTAAWLDAASGGRMILGLGTGDPVDAPEHRAYGLPIAPMPERRAHLEETLRALSELFAGGSYTGGELVPALRGPLRPPPASPGGPQVWVGAVADPVVAMAGGLADGWNGWGLNADTFAAKARLAREAGAEAGREIEAGWAGVVLVGENRTELGRLLEARAAGGLGPPTWSGTVEDLREHAAALEDSGAAWLCFHPAGPPDRLEVIWAVLRR